LEFDSKSHRVWSRSKNKSL